MSQNTKQSVSVTVEKVENGYICHFGTHLQDFPLEKHIAKTPGEVQALILDEVKKLGDLPRAK